MSAALRSRNAGTVAANWLLLSDYAPFEVGELLADCYSYQKSLLVSFTVQGGRLVTTSADGLVESQAQSHSEELLRPTHSAPVLQKQA